MRTFALFGAKKFGFFQIYWASARTRGRGVEPVQTFCGQGGGGAIFCDFMRTAFMDGPFLRKPNDYNPFRRLLLWGYWLIYVSFSLPSKTRHWIADFQFRIEEHVKHYNALSSVRIYYNLRLDESLIPINQKHLSGFFGRFVNYLTRNIRRLNKKRNEAHYSIRLLPSLCCM